MYTPPLEAVSGARPATTSCSTAKNVAFLRYGGARTATHTLKQEQPRILAVRNIFIPVKSAPRLNDTHRENMQRYLPTPPRSHISRVGVSRLLDNATDLIFEGAQRSIRGLDVCRSRQAAQRQKRAVAVTFGNALVTISSPRRNQ